MALKTVSTSELKARVAEVVDSVASGRGAVVVTRRGKPVARIVPIEDKPRDVFGCLAGTITIHGDIMEPIDVEWEAGG